MVKDRLDIFMHIIRRIELQTTGKIIEIVISAYHVQRYVVVDWQVVVYAMAEITPTGDFNAKPLAAGSFI